MAPGHRDGLGYAPGAQPESQADGLVGLAGPACGEVTSEGGTCKALRGRRQAGAADGRGARAGALVGVAVDALQE